MRYRRRTIRAKNGPINIKNTVVTFILLPWFTISARTTSEVATNFFGERPCSDGYEYEVKGHESRWAFHTAAIRLKSSTCSFVFFRGIKSKSAKKTPSLVSKHPLPEGEMKRGERKRELGSISSLEKMNRHGRLSGVTHAGKASGFRQKVHSLLEIEPSRPGGK